MHNSKFKKISARTECGIAIKRETTKLNKKKCKIDQNF